MDNMTYWSQLQTTPQEARKPIQAGRLKGMTDINPMWRLKMLTQVFGPCGIGWRYKVVDRWLERADNKEIKAFVQIELSYRAQIGDEVVWSEPVPGIGGSSFVALERGGAYVSDECYKMALTDAISVACKALGMSADIYFAADRDKYNSQQPQDVGGRNMAAGLASRRSGHYGEGGAQGMAAGVSGHYGDGGGQRAGVGTGPYGEADGRRQAPRQPEGPGGQQTLMPDSGQCERCGRVTPAEMLDRGRQAYGAALCYDCQRAIRQQQAAAVRRAEQQQARMTG